MNSIEYIQESFRGRELELISKLSIINKKKKRQRLDPLFSNQKNIIRAILNGDSAVILKARQLGISTAIVAVFFIIAFLSPDPLTLVILSHKQKSSQTLLEIAKELYLSLPASIREIHPATLKANEISFTKTGASLVAESAESKGGLRSTSVSHLLLTEFSLAPRPDELLASGLAALNDGILVIEGTAQKFGDCLYQEYTKAVRGETRYKPFFMAWFAHEEYRKKPGPDFTPTPEEEELAKKYNLDLEQLVWRREKVAEFGLAKIKTEYPSSFEEAYDQLPNAFIPSEDLQKIKVSDLAPNIVHRLLPAQPNQTYVIGADPSMGVGSHYSSLHLLDARTLELCAFYHSNQTPPTNLAEIIGRLSVEYNRATVNLESNHKCGGIVLAELIRDKITILKINNKVWDTSSSNKAPLLELIRKTIASARLKTLDRFTYLELRNTTINSDGTLNLKELKSHFDGGISLGLALYAANNVKLPRSANILSMFD